MKHFVLAGLTLFLLGCGQTTEEMKADMEDHAKSLEDGKASNALEYNDGIVGLQARFLTEFMEMIKVLDQLSAEEYKASTADLEKIIDESTAHLEKLEPYEHGEDLRVAMMDWFKVYRHIVVDIYPEMMELNNKTEEELTDEDYLRYAELEQEIDVTATEVDERFAQVQRIYASAHGMGLEDNPLDAEMDALLEETEEY